MYILLFLSLVVVYIYYRLKEKEKEAWVREAKAEELVRQLRSELSTLEIDNDRLR